MPVLSVIGHIFNSDTFIPLKFLNLWILSVAGNLSCWSHILIPWIIFEIPIQKNLEQFQFLLSIIVYGSIAYTPLLSSFSHQFVFRKRSYLKFLLMSLYHQGLNIIVLIFYNVLSELKGLSFVQIVWTNS